MASDFKQTEKESVSVDNKLSTTSRGSSASSAGSHRNPNLLRSYHNLAMHLFNTGPEREVEKLFLVAARDGQYDRVENFLQRRSHEIVNIDVKDPVTGNTPLIWAAKHGHEKIVQLLLKYGADVTLNNCEHQTAVGVAQPNIRRILINSVDRTGSSPRHLLQAAWQGNLKVVQKLLKESRVLDINCRNADSLTPLLLVTRDVDVFHKLGDAMKNYNPEAVVVELLLNRADPNASDNEGRTALHYTASLKCKLAEKVTLALLQDGSQVEVRDKHCVTPVHFASQNGQVEVLLALLANGANVNIRGYAGTTPLHVSAQANQFQSVNTLLNQGADITLVDDRGFTPVDVARNKKMKSTLKDAWMEATSNKQEQTVLSPVKPPSRASLSRISIDEKTPRGTPRDVHINSPDKVNIVQKMTEAHKALKAEEQILKDLEADHFPPGLTSKKLKTPIPPKTPKSEKTTAGSSSSNPAPLLDRSKTKRSLLFESRVKGEAEIGHKASTKGHQKLAQRHSDPTRPDQNLVPVTIVGLDLDEHADDMRLQRLLNSPINGFLERQKKRGSLPEVNPLPSYRSAMRRKSTPNKQTISEVLEVVNDYQKQDQIQVCFTSPSPLNDGGKLHPFSRTVLPPSPGLQLESQHIIQETIFEFDSENEGSQSALTGKRRLQNPKPDSGNHLNLSRAGTLMSQKRTFNIEMSRVKSSSESDQSSSQSSMSCTSSSMSSFSTPSPQDSPRVDLISNNQNFRTSNRMGVKMTPAATVTQKESSEMMEVKDVERTSDSVLESDQDSGVVSSSSSPPRKRSNTAGASKKDRVLLREVSEDFTAKVFPVDCDSHLDKNLGSNKPTNDVIHVNFITSSEPAKTMNKNASSDCNVSNTSKNSSGKVNSNTTNILSSEKLTKPKQKQSPRVATSAKSSFLIQESNKGCDKISNRTVSKSAGAVKVSVTCDTVKNKLETLNPAPVISKTSPTTKPSPKLSSGTPSVANSFSRLPKEDLASATDVSTIKNDANYEVVTIKNDNSIKPNNVNPLNIISVKHIEKSLKNDAKDGCVSETLATKHNKNIENAEDKPTESATNKVVDTTTALEANKPSNTCIVDKSCVTHHKNEHSSSKKQTSNNVTNKNVEVVIRHSEKQKADKTQTSSNTSLATQTVKNVPEKIIIIQAGDTPKPHILGKKLEMQDRPAEKCKTEEASTAKLTPRIPSAPKPAGPGRPKSQFKSPETSPRIKEESGKKKPAPSGVISGKDNKVHNTPVICDMFENMKTEVEISKGAKTVTERKKVLKQNGRNNSGKQKRSQSAPKDKALKESSKVANKGNPASQSSSVNKKKKISKEKPDVTGKTKGKPKTCKAVEVNQERKKTPKKRKKKPNEDTMVVKDADANTTAFISGQGWHIKTKKNESDNVIIHNQLLMDDSSDSEGSIKLSPHNTLKIQEVAKMRSMTQEQVCNFKNVMSPLEANTPKYIPDTMGTIKTFIANALKDDCNNLHNQLSTRQFSFEENEMKSICEAKEKEILLRKKGNKDIVEGPVKGLASNLLTPRSEVDNLSLYSESSYDTNPELLKVFKIPDHVDNEEQEVIESDVEEIEVEPVHFVEEAVKEHVMNPVMEKHINNDSNKHLQADASSESPGTRNSSATSTSSRVSSSTIRKTKATKDCEAELANKPPLPSHQPKKLPKSAFKKRYSEPVINYSQDEYDELDKEYFDERVRKYSAGVREKNMSVEPKEKVSSSTANCNLDEGCQKEAGKDKINEFSILDGKSLPNDSKVNNTVDRNQSESDVFDDHKNNLQNVQRAENPVNQLSADNPDKILVDTDFLPPINLQRPSEGSDEEIDLLNDSLTLSIMSDVLEKTLNEASRTGSSWSADSVTRTSILGKGRSHSSRVSSSDRSHSSSTSVSETEEELLHWKKGNILGKGAFGQVRNNVQNIFLPGVFIWFIKFAHFYTKTTLLQLKPDRLLFSTQRSCHLYIRDIKGANIMLMSNGIIKLIDFGCAKRLCINLSQSQSLLMSMRGTPYWMAPEVIMETGHGTKSDIWSIGCTVFEMATRKPPWAEMPPMTAIYSIGSGSGPVPQLPEQFSKEAKSFVSVCLLRNQNERPTATDLLKHAFIRKRRERGRDRFSTRISSSTFEEGNINFKEKPKSEVTKDKNSKKPIYDFS
ncbi:uncharacterized protein LOC117102891 [Anneissia japonica]|uniref:uncharacterized protein LOC117102891 n=1 Tax=Anneissia japonica TaxID=1529436 RepID=UPI00142570BA|nr:uncharacterized protein LOC117102891 [Anneissia japonica]